MRWLSMYTRRGRININLEEINSQFFEWEKKKLFWSHIILFINNLWHCMYALYSVEIISWCVHETIHNVGDSSLLTVWCLLSWNHFSTPMGSQTVPHVLKPGLSFWAARLALSPVLFNFSFHCSALSVARQARSLLRLFWSLLSLLDSYDSPKETPISLVELIVWKQIEL